MQTEKGETEAVNRPARQVLRAGTDRLTKSMSDLPSGLVRKGDSADACGVDLPHSDEVVNPLGEAEGLPGTWARNDKNGTERCLDGATLLRGRSQPRVDRANLQRRYSTDVRG